MKLYEKLVNNADKYADKLAISTPKETITYKQLLERVNATALELDSTGVQPGNRIAILALNSAEWFVLLFAAVHRGVVLVPLNWRLSISELNYVLKDCNPDILLHDTEFSQTVNKLLPENGDINVANLQQLCTNSNDNPHCSAHVYEDRSALLIVYTSGTTGRPKGAVLDEQAILCSAAMSQDMLDLSPADVVLNVLPLFHVGGLNIQPLPALLYGATLVIHERFEPEHSVNALIDHQITLINTVPTVLQAMLSSNNWPTTPFHSLRAISIGSTDVPVSLIRKVQDHGYPLIQIYGATETGPAAIYQRIEDSVKTGSIGRAGKYCNVRLVDTKNQPVGTGKSGEIQVKGDNVLLYYWQNTEATNNSLSDGWFSTGDIAHQDSDGFFWFDDRTKHVIISGGENIYPAELERLLSELDGVKAVSVVGVADARWGEVPVVVVCGTASKKAVMNACSTLAKFKQPKQVIFMDELPRNALGKIQVQRVRDLIAGL